MEVTFRYNEAVGPINHPPDFVFSLRDDGFTITVPAGYTVTVNRLPTGVQGQAAAGEGVNEMHEDEDNQLNDDDVNEDVPVDFTDQISQASVHRKLSQSEVLYLLQNDTIVLSTEVARPPTEGLFMYPIALMNRRDCHKYGGSHFRQDLEIGNERVPIKYRWSLVEDPNLIVTARRYKLNQDNADKFLVHYLQGHDHVDDNVPEIPIQPELPLA